MKISRLISIAIISLIGISTGMAQFRPNRFTTNGDPGAWVYLPMPQLTAYANGTNFYVDWTTNAYSLNATGDVWFQYSTNWGLPGTNRFATISVPPRQNYRHIYFANAATNWHSEAHALEGIPTGYGATIKLVAPGSGETNVTYSAQIDERPTGTNWQGNFTPSSIGGLTLWWEASQQVYEDEFGTQIARNGGNVRAMNDLTGNYGLATNSSLTSYLFYRGPNDSVGNIPALNFTAGSTAYLVTKTFTAVTQPNWCFMVFYGRGGNVAFFDGLSEGNRFAFIPSQTPANQVNNYSGSSLQFVPAPKIAWTLYSFEQNGSSAITRTNGVQAVTGNGGTQTPTRWTIGTDYNLGATTGNSYLAELLVYHGTLTAANITNIETYLWNKYGTPHP